ncbi:hypothetical protein [Gelria sp. Kuro-4]|uniref:hypothetical protein n=1 Tax=Gelria sp. Kuro-4 TaxID=2796927 RepID=UPI001C7E4BCC|nr:hypothetical protein [Gelria sp. Kuro-4]
MIELTIPDKMLERTLTTIEEVAQQIDTVFSLDLISRLRRRTHRQEVEEMRGLACTAVFNPDRAAQLLQ